MDKSRTRGKAEAGGSGLGLAIVKRILELHHSEIRVDSTVDKGTVFTFDLRPTGGASSTGRSRAGSAA